MANTIFRVVLFASVFICSSLLFSHTSSAQPGECRGQITKDAEGGGATPFHFIVTQEGGEVLFEGDLVDGESTGGGIEQGLPVTVIEEPAEGWELVDVICTPAEGMETDVIRGGVVFTCVSPTEEISNCTFVNESTGGSATIPTLSEWGMIAAAAGLGLVGFFAVRRRRAVRA